MDRPLAPETTATYDEQGGPTDTTDHLQPLSQCKVHTLTHTHTNTLLTTPILVGE